jgi:hypothetical protein
MLRLVAPLTDQLNVLFCPPLMVAGLAVKLVITGAGTTVTVVRATTEAEEEPPPAELMAVNRYVVVFAGFTVTLLRPVTSPTPWLMLRLVAPVTDQFKVVLWISLVTAGLAVKLWIAGLSTTVSVSDALLDCPAGFVAVRV